MFKQPYIVMQGCVVLLSACIAVHTTKEVKHNCYHHLVPPVAPTSTKAAPIVTEAAPKSTTVYHRPLEYDCDEMYT